MSLPDEIYLIASNQSGSDRPETLLTVDMSDVKALFSDGNFQSIAVYDDGVQLPVQIHGDQLLFTVNAVPARTSKTLALRKNIDLQNADFPRRAQAELSVKVGGKFENRKYVGGAFQNVQDLRVPAEHTDHSYYIRYEGPGWESDQVGYRFYLDWRNATDVFGKSSPDVMLQQVGLDGFDSYHERQAWGMDILKVGQSLGLGSPAMMVAGEAQRMAQTDSVHCTIAANGPLYAAIETRYSGWKTNGKSIDVRSLLSIHAGTRLTRHTLEFSEDPQNFCSGIVKDESAHLYTSQGNDDHWGYLATYGRQSLNGDKLGLALVFAPESFRGFTEDVHSHIVKLHAINDAVEYYYLAAWEAEQDGIDNEAEFLQYLKATVHELANPLAVKVATDLSATRDFQNK
jgi:hypothetical protein